MDANEKLDFLRGQNYEYLAGLPSVVEEEIAIEGKKGTMSVWNDLLPSGERRIVVACYTPTFFRLGVRVRAEGFAVAANNAKRPLSDEELAPFI